MNTRNNLLDTLLSFPVKINSLLITDKILQNIFSYMSEKNMESLSGKQKLISQYILFKSKLIIIREFIEYITVTSGKKSSKDKFDFFSKIMKNVLVVNSGMKTIDNKYYLLEISDLKKIIPIYCIFFCIETPNVNNIKIISDSFFSKNIKKELLKKRRRIKFYIEYIRVQLWIDIERIEPSDSSKNNREKIIADSYRNISYGRLEYFK